MNTVVMNAAPMGQCIDPAMMTARLCLALNAICKCQESIAHRDLYSKVADGVANSERIYRY